MEPSSTTTRSSEKRRERLQRSARDRGLNKLSEDYYWNPLKWFGMEPSQQSPVEEEPAEGEEEGGSYFDFFKSDKGKGRAKDDTNDENEEAQQDGDAAPNGSAVHSPIHEDDENQASSSTRPPVSRHRSMPQIREQPKPGLTHSYELQVGRDCAPASPICCIERRLSALARPSLRPMS